MAYVSEPTWFWRINSEMTWRVAAQYEYTTQDTFINAKICSRKTDFVIYAFVCTVLMSGKAFSPESNTECVRHAFGVRSE